jgi:hypothetical protein
LRLLAEEAGRKMVVKGENALPCLCHMIRFFRRKPLPFPEVDPIIIIIIVVSL